MHTCKILSDGDRVIVAVSGGVDSPVLAWVLNFRRTKAPSSYDLTAVHIDMEPDDEGPGTAASTIQTILSSFDVSLEILPACRRPDKVQAEDSSSRKDICFSCARHVAAIRRSDTGMPQGQGDMVLMQGGCR